MLLASSVLAGLEERGVLSSVESSGKRSEKERDVSIWREQRSVGAVDTLERYTRRSFPQIPVRVFLFVQVFFDKTPPTMKKRKEIWEKRGEEDRESDTSVPAYMTKKV